jgi:hypothetical protein
MPFIVLGSWQPNGTSSVEYLRPPQALWISRQINFEIEHNHELGNGRVTIVEILRILSV